MCFSMQGAREMGLFGGDAVVFLQPASSQMLQSNGQLFN